MATMAYAEDPALVAGVVAGGLLSPVEERELAVAIEAGVLAGAALDGVGPPCEAERDDLVALVRRGVEAQRRFVLANLGLVRSISGPEARRSNLAELELFQEGCVALLRAMQAFDHRRGCRFSTFALPRVRAAITIAAARRLGARELPGWRALLLRRAHGTAGRLAAQLGREPALDEVAAALDRPPQWLGELLAHRRPASLDQLLEAGIEVGEPDPGLGATAHSDLGDALQRLPSPQREVLRWRFGLDDGHPHSRIETGRHLGIGRDQVRDAELLGLDRLRAELDDRGTSAIR